MNELSLFSPMLSRMSKYTDWMDDVFTSSVVNFHKQWKSFLPYNFSINKEKNTAHFEMALAGFAPSELDVQFNDGILSIKNKSQENKDDAVEYVHKGIAARLFEFAMPLNPSYEVTDATLKNGILKINFKKLNTTSKKIEIKTA